MEKKVFAQIRFDDCDMDYNYTICPWSEVQINIESAVSSLENVTVGDLDEDEPKIVISPIIMTDQEYGAWFEKHVHP